RHADLAQRHIDVVLAQRAALAQTIEDIGETIAQAFEHGDPDHNAEQASARHSRTGRPPRGARFTDASTEAGGSYGAAVALSIPRGRRKPADRPFERSRSSTPRRYGQDT